MTATSLLLLETSFKTIAFLFAVAAAYLIFSARRQTDRSDLVRKWFRRKWLRIRQSPWLELPQIVVEWFYNQKSLLVRFSLNANTKWRFGKLAFSEMIMLSILSSLFVEQYEIAKFLVIYYSLLILSWKSLKAFISKKQGELSGEKVEDKSTESTTSMHPLQIPLTVIVISFAILFPIVSIVSVVVITIGILQTNVYVAAFLSVVLLPMYWNGIGIPTLLTIGVYKVIQVVRRGDVELLERLAEDEELKSKVMARASVLHSFAIGVSLSFVVTILALLIGHIGSPDSWIPMTMQMLISNLLFDGFTMVTTFSLLGWYLQRRSSKRLFGAVAADIVACGILACLSLYFALVFTDQALSFNEVARILVALSPNQNEYDLGPYFWAMHSTFLPTLIYVGILLLCWFGKELLLVVRWFFLINAESKRPLELTSCLLGVLATVFFGLGVAMEQAHKFLQGIE